MVRRTCVCSTHLRMEVIMASASYVLGLILLLAGSIAVLVKLLRRRSDQAAFDGEITAQRQVHHDKATEELRIQLRKLLKQLAISQFSAPEPRRALQQAVALLLQAHMELERNLERTSALLHDAEECIRQAKPVPNMRSHRSFSTRLTLSAILGNSPTLWWFGHLLIVYRLTSPIARSQPPSTSA